MRLQERSL